MNILVVSHMFPKEYNASHGIFVFNQAKALLKLGHNVVVVSPIPYVPPFLDKVRSKWRNYRGQPFEAHREGIKVYYPRIINIPGGHMLHKSGLLYYMGIRSLIRNIYRDFKFDMINCHATLPDGQCGLYLKDYFKKPLVVTIHGQDMNITIHRSIANRKAVARVINLCDRVVCVSGRLADEAKSLVENNHGKIHVINNGFDASDVFSGESRLREELGADIVILSVGKLTKTKGFDILIEACESILKSREDTKLVIIGDGPEKQKLFNMVNKLKLNRKVVFTGHLPGKKVMEYMSQVDIFALPSWKEGFGLVYLEAMAHGKPVVGVKGQGIEDIIQQGENGMLVNPKDVYDLKKTLELLIVNPELREYMAVNGKNTVEGLSWKANAVKTTELYEEIIND